MSAYRKQHYVPQSYLRAWSPDGRRVWMYDKVTSASRLVGIASVCQGTYFNDAFRRDRGRVTDALPADLYESEFRKWEDRFLLARDIALGIVAGTRSGTLEERSEMSICIALQLMRTATMRRVLIAQADEPRSGVPHDLLGWLPLDLQHCIARRPAFVRENAAFIQAHLIWRSGLVTRIATELFHYHWAVGSNQTGMPFYASDSAIAALLHRRGEEPFAPDPVPYSEENEGMSLVKRLFCSTPSDMSVELVFPVNPECALLMFHPYDFERAVGPHQGQVLVLSQRTVMIHNVVIAGHATRQVISNANRFDIAEAAVRYDRAR